MYGVAQHAIGEARYRPASVRTRRIQTQHRPSHTHSDSMPPEFRLFEIKKMLETWRAKIDSELSTMSKRYEGFEESMGCAMALKSLFVDQKSQFFRAYINDSRQHAANRVDFARWNECVELSVDDDSNSDVLRRDITAISEELKGIYDVWYKRAEFRMVKTVVVESLRLIKSNVYVQTGAFIAEAIEAATHDEAFKDIPIMNERLDPVALEIAKGISGTLVFMIELFAAQLTGMSYPMIMSMSRMLMSDLDQVFSVASVAGMDAHDVLDHLETIEWGLGLCVQVGFHLTTKELSLMMALFSASSYVLGTVGRSIAGKGVDYAYGKTKDKNPSGNSYFLIKYMAQYIGFFLGQLAAPHMISSAIDILKLRQSGEFLANSEKYCISHANECDRTLRAFIGVSPEANYTRIRAKCREDLAFFHPDQRTHVLFESTSKQLLLNKDRQLHAYQMTLKAKELFAALKKFTT